MGVSVTAAQFRAIAGLLSAAREVQDAVGETGPIASDVGIAEWGAGLIVVRIPLRSERFDVETHYVVRPDGSSRTIFDKTEKQLGEDSGRTYEKAMKRGFYFNTAEDWSSPA